GLVVRPLHFLTNRVRRNVVLFLQYQPPNLRKVFLGIRIIPLLGITRPQSVLVELKAILLESTEHHRAETAVAKRESIRPFGSRTVIPENELIRSSGSSGSSSRADREKLAPVDSSHVLIKMKDLRNWAHLFVGGQPGIALEKLLHLSLPPPIYIRFPHL